MRFSKSSILDGVPASITVIRSLADVDDLALEDADEADHLAPVGRGGRDGGEEHLPFGGVLGGELEDVDDVDELVELAEDLLEGGRLDVDDDGDPRERSSSVGATARE